MKVKLQLVAEKPDGEGKFKKVNDALQVIDLDGNKIAVENFGKQLSNVMFTAPTPPAITDVIEYRREIERLHDNKGKEFEISEEVIPLMKEAIKKAWTFFVFEAATEWIEKAIAQAKMSK